jgi:predicted kinase
MLKRYGTGIFAPRNPRNIFFSHEEMVSRDFYRPTTGCDNATTDDDGPDGRWPMVVPHPLLIMLLLWLLPLLFQLSPQFTHQRITMSDAWETTTTSRQRRDQRRRKDREKGQSAAMESSPPPIDDADEANAIEADAVPKPFVLLLAGLPGSGKSTLSEQLMNANSKYVHVNQDILGSRPKCLTAARNALLAGKFPIVDRCNFNAQQRRYFIDLAKELGGCAVHCVVLVHVDRAQCLYRCQQRRGHPTLIPSEAAKVIGFVNKDWRLPTEREGIDRIWIVNNEQQYQDVAAFYS